MVLSLSLLIHGKLITITKRCCNLCPVIRLSRLTLTCSALPTPCYCSPWHEDWVFWDDWNRFILDVQLYLSPQLGHLCRAIAEVCNVTTRQRTNARSSSQTVFIWLILMMLLSVTNAYRSVTSMSPIFINIIPQHWYYSIILSGPRQKPSANELLYATFLDLTKCPYDLLQHPDHKWLCAAGDCWSEQHLLLFTISDRPVSISPDASVLLTYNA
jgi:hypothetical protein